MFLNARAGNDAGVPSAATPQKTTPELRSAWTGEDARPYTVLGTDEPGAPFFADFAKSGVLPMTR